ncbi:CopD family protein [Nocardioides sp. NPDC127503]|uniref:CopD family protein n=1 Tax=Nocardioides sp. NPDC127503 TaxID=3154516 RepID=UPI003321A7E9
MVAAVVLIIMMVSPAEAHAELERSTPVDGATVTKLPAQATSGRIEVSVDGAETPAPKEPNALPEEPRAIGWLAASSRVLGYLALALFIGGLLFISVLWPAGARERRTHGLLVIAVVSGIVAAVNAMVVVLWRAFGATTLRQALTEDFGRADAAMILLWLLAAVVVVALVQGGERAVSGLAWRVGAIFVAAGLVRTAGMNAHATQTDEPLWGIVAGFLHLSAVSAWVGGLTMLTLCLLPRRRLAELEVVVPKFSKVAALSVLTIVVSGAILLWQIVASVDGFWATDYSRVLMLKLALFVLVMLAAMKSKHWVDRRLARAVVESRRPTATRSFVVSVAAETVLVVSVLGAAGVLVTSSPGV